MYDIELPNGYVVEGVPEGTSKQEVMDKAIKAGWATAEDFGTTQDEIGFEKDVLRNGLVADIMGKDTFVQAGPNKGQRILTDEEVEQAELELGSENRKSAIRNFGQGITLGLADEAEALYTSMTSDRSYDEVKDQIGMERRQYAAENPGEAMVQELAGGVMSPTLLGTIKNPTVAAMTTGGIYGAASADGDLVDRAQGGVAGMAVGGILTASLNKVANTVANTKLNFVTKAATKEPTVTNLKRVKDVAYEAVPKKTILFDKASTASVQRQTGELLVDEGYQSFKGTITPVERAKAMINKVDELTFDNYDKLRQNLFGLVDNTNEGRLVRKMIEKLDDVADARLVASGDKTLLAAREANKTYQKVKMLDDELEKVRIDMKGVKNVNPYEAMRGTATKILKDPKKTRFLDEADKKLLEDFANAPIPDRIANKMSKFAPSGGGLLAVAQVAAGATMGNPLVMLLGIASTEGAKIFKDQRTVSAAKKLVDQLGGVSEVEKLIRMNVAVPGLTAMGPFLDQMFPE